MVADTELSVLRAADPAAELAPLAERQRLTLRDEAMALVRHPVRRRARFPRRSVRVALALAMLALIATGVAWAAGAFRPPTPLALFKTNPQGSMNLNTGLGRFWNQTVIPDSVKKVATVQIPKVGPVTFWYAQTEQGGWCAGLRLSNGDWLGTPQARLLHLGPGGRSIGMGGGVAPGCFPTVKMTHKAKQGRAPNGFDCLQNEIDARSVGELWQIRYGRITAPGAVTVRDLTSGKSTNVLDGNLFILAIRHPPRHLRILHPVAYDNAANIVASGCPNFNGH